MGLIIPVSLLNKELPGDATDEDGALTEAVTRASNYCNNWAVNYLPFPAYSEDGSENVTINAPYEIAGACLEIAKSIYWLGQSEVQRNGEEKDRHHENLKWWKEELKTVEIEPTEHNQEINLDSNGCMLIGSQKVQVVPWPCYVISSGTTNWNNWDHFTVRKGGLFDTELTNSWYFDASSYKTSIGGTLVYYRTWRKDARDYAKYSQDMGVDPFYDQHLDRSN